MARLYLFFFSLCLSPIQFYLYFHVDNVNLKMSKQLKNQATVTRCPLKETAANIVLQLKHKMEIITSQRASNASKPASNGRL